MKARKTWNLENLWLAPALLSAAVFLAYGMTLSAPVMADDVPYVRDNAVFRMPPGPFLRELFSARYFRLSLEGTYQPLVTLFHYFTHASPSAYRLAGILLHALNSFLVFLLGRRLGARPAVAFAAAALFALFPGHTETVNFSSYKGHLLGFGLGLASLLGWAHALEEGGAWALPLSYAAYLLALLSKETGTLFLGLGAAYSWCHARKSPGFQIKAGLGFLALTLAYLWLRFGFLEQLPAGASYSSAGSLRILGWYIRMLLLPYPLCLERGLGGPQLYVPALLFLALIFLSRRSKALFGLLWIGVGLLPYLRLVGFAAVNPVADRYLYLPAAGFCLLLGRYLSEGALRLALYGFVLVWGAFTIARNGLYRDERALAEQTVACAPASPRAHLMLGSFYLSASEYPRARESLKRAVELDPNFMLALNNLGIVYYRMKDYAASREAFERALRLAEEAPLHNNLANVLAAEKRDEEAYRHYRRAWEMRPGWPDPYLNAALLLKKKNPRLAEELMRKAQALSAP